MFVYVFSDVLRKSFSEKMRDLRTEIREQQKNVFEDSGNEFSRYIYIFDTFIFICWKLFGIDSTKYTFVISNF